MRLEIAQCQRPAVQGAVDSSPCKIFQGVGEKQSHKHLFPAKKPSSGGEAMERADR